MVAPRDPLPMTERLNRNSQPLLDVRDLSVSYRLGQGKKIHAVDRVSFTLEQGERIGLVGESGSGKSTIAKAILRLLPENARTTHGNILFRGRDLLRLSETELNEVRWLEISLVTQSAMNALNPVARISEQFLETFAAHGMPHKQKVMLEAEQLFDLVGLSKRRIHEYPHQFSGGMRQRVIIAMAVALNPKLIIADEPTTALDVIMQAQIINLLRSLSEAKKISLVLITHDISLVAEICEKVGVMYAGRLMEFGPIEMVFDHPFHPYTMGLKGALPSISDLDKELVSIPGSPPELTRPLDCCGFAPRCPFAVEACYKTVPDTVEVEPGHLCACLRMDHAEEFRLRIKEILLAETAKRQAAQELHDRTGRC